MQINITLTKPTFLLQKKESSTFNNKSQVKLHFLNIDMEKPALKLYKIT